MPGLPSLTQILLISANSTTIRVLIAVPLTCLRTGRGKDVYFHVGSATSNLTLWVNGKYVGYSEDSKVAAEFNISKYLKPRQEPHCYAGDALV